jgi:hypothetical protein
MKEEDKITVHDGGNGSHAVILQVNDQIFIYMQPHQLHELIQNAEGFLGQNPIKNISQRKGRIKL